LYAKAASTRAWTPSSVRAKALRGAGVTLIDLGRLDEAQTILERSLTLEPDNNLARSELAYIDYLRDYLRRGIRATVRLSLSRRENKRAEEMRMELTYQDIEDITVAVCYLWDDLFGGPVAESLPERLDPGSREELVAVAADTAPELVYRFFREEPFPSDALMFLAHSARVDYLRSGAAMLLVMTKLASAVQGLRQKAAHASRRESVLARQPLQPEEPVQVEFTTADLNVISTALGMAGAGYPYPAWYGPLVNRKLAERGHTHPVAREMRGRFKTLYDRINPLLADEDIPFPPY